MTISVVLATRNEALNIAKCLDSVNGLADEIVIADENSTDETILIAKKYKAKVICVDHQQNFHITKNIAIDAATKDWILQLDADEVVSPELASEIKVHLQGGRMDSLKVVGYWINRSNWFLDRFLTKGGQYPDPTLRLYKRGHGRLPAKDVHEQATVHGTVGHLKNNLLHYRDTSFEKYLDGFNRYSTFMASQIKDPISIISTLKFIVLKPITIFTSIFIRHRGYVDGRAGFIFALFSGWVPAVAYIKYWQQKTHPS